MSPNPANANATVNATVNAGVNHNAPSSSTISNGTSLKDKDKEESGGAAVGTEANSQGQGQDGRERESKEAVRDLTAVFASCDSSAVPPTVTSSKEVSSSKRVAEVILKTRPHIVPILSFTPFLEQEATATATVTASVAVAVTDSVAAAPTVSKSIEIPSGRVPDAITSPTSIVHPPPIATSALPLPLPLPSSLLLQPSLPNPPPAYPSCFVGSTRRGSLTRYTQLCNKMEPLIENVLERMDSTGNLLDLDSEISLRRTSIVNKLKKLNKIRDKDENEIDKNNEKATEISSFLYRSGSSIENIVEGGIPFSTFGKTLPAPSSYNMENIVKNNSNNDKYNVNEIKLKDEITISETAYIINKIDNSFIEEKIHSLINFKNKTDDNMTTEIENEILNTNSVKKLKNDGNVKSLENKFMETNNHILLENIPSTFKFEHNHEFSSGSVMNINKNPAEVSDLKNSVKSFINGINNCNEKSIMMTTSTVATKTTTTTTTNIPAIINDKSMTSNNIKVDDIKNGNSPILENSNSVLNSYSESVAAMTLNKNNNNKQNMDISLQSNDFTTNGKTDSIMSNSIIANTEIAGIKEIQRFSGMHVDTKFTEDGKTEVEKNENNNNNSNNDYKSIVRNDAKEHSSNISDIVVPLLSSFSSSSSSASSSVVLNNGSSFKQLQYQMRQQRHQQQYQIQEPELDSTQLNINNNTGALSSYRPNLHLEMSSLANSLSLNGQPQTSSYSIAHMRVREFSLAQAMVGNTNNNHNSNDDNNGVTQIIPEVEYDDSDAQQELLTDKAVTVIRRVMDKLTGLDFYDPASLTAPTALDVPEQVDRLIIQATAHENLCLSFLGWCPFW